METYQVVLNGKPVLVNVPDGATDEQVRAAAADVLKRAGFSNPSAHQVLRPDNALAQQPPQVNGGPNALQGLPEASISEYDPTWSEWAGHGVGNALAGVLGQHGAVTFGNKLGGFLENFTPLGNIDDLASGDETRAQLAALPLPGPARRGAGLALDAVEGGIRSARGKLSTFNVEGNEHFLEYTGPDGQTAYGQAIMNPDGTAEISLDPFSKASNRFGPAQMRDMAAQFRQLYPDVRAVWGERLTGANPGRVQNVRFK